MVKASGAGQRGADASCPEVADLTLAAELTNTVLRNMVSDSLTAKLPTIHYSGS